MLVKAWARWVEGCWMVSISRRLMCFVLRSAAVEYRSADMARLGRAGDIAHGLNAARCGRAGVRVHR
jgi:hypothetical protein